MAFKDKKVESFLKEVASSSPTPGGGSVAAVTGATAASLVEMVANLTIGKKGYEKVEKEMEAVAKEVSKLGKNLLVLADKDAEAFEMVMKAYKMKKEDTKREGAIQKAFKNAAEIPAETANLSKKVFMLAKKAEKIGNKNANSDAKVAMHLATAAIASAVENVKINLPYIKDKDFVAKTRKSLSRLK